MTNPTSLKILDLSLRRKNHGKRTKFCCSAVQIIRLFTIEVHPRLNTTTFNAFPHNKILDQIKLKAFADDKFNATKMMISVFDRVENIVGKEEIACTRHFSFSHNIFKRLLSRPVKRCHCVGMG